MGLFLHLIVVLDLFLTSALGRDHGIIFSTEHLAGMGFWGSRPGNSAPQHSSLKTGVSDLFLIKGPRINTVSFSGHEAASRR